MHTGVHWNSTVLQNPGLGLSTGRPGCLREEREFLNLGASNWHLVDSPIAIQLHFIEFQWRISIGGKAPELLYSATSFQKH